MTLKEFIEQNPNATLNMMTPGGYVLLTPERSKKLLHGEGVIAHAGSSDVRIAIRAEELLPQEVVSCKPHKSEPDYFYLITAWEQEHREMASKVAGTMRAACWRGERPFSWEDISFEQEIIQDDNLLNFYVPILFDAHAVFGAQADKLGVDDSYNVYANYNLDEGDISEFLEIYIKYADGCEDTAMYHLNAEEQKMFLRKMNDYCQQQTGTSLATWSEKYMQEQQAPSQQMCGMQM